MHSRFLTLLLLLPLLFHAASAASVATEAKGALPPPTKLHTKLEPAELVKAVLDHVHSSAVKQVHTYLAYMTARRDELNKAAMVAAAAESEFSKAITLETLPPETTNQLGELLKKRIQATLSKQASQFYPPMAFIAVMEKTKWKKRQAKDSEAPFGAYHELVDAWFALPKNLQDTIIIGNSVNTIALFGPGPEKIPEDVLKYIQCAHKVNLIRSRGKLLTMLQLSKLEHGNVPEEVTFDSMLAHVFSRVAQSMTRVLRDLWWQKLAANILTSQ